MLCPEARGRFESYPKSSRKRPAQAGLLSVAPFRWKFTRHDLHKLLAKTDSTTVAA